MKLRISKGKRKIGAATAYYIPGWRHQLQSAVSFEMRKNDDCNPLNSLLKTNKGRVYFKEYIGNKESDHEKSTWIT